ncbi:phosphonate ABC transporter ATP-binding protein [Sulfurospirillum multivorans]|uniref:Phosphonate/phosphate ABC transporter ATP-binding protein n=2 Tax=Sulfurospirillum multivorans TaxID=66821 RepID=A0AA86AQM3_SULMK|nr:phosphonate ABC transporter ATP-binding protein [Sulfurospirillum multivorans]AHJ14017.1 phosphonate/phosphate ABC transporter ATP-binding protein [Sulfurospirillum multivorans DSM 12446]QEH07504.1 phosphonate/phosphate ABC transporter ATP-binding protein [Sulfurospirillum multivorans]
MLSIQHLSKSYKDARLVLDDVNFDVQKGEMVGLIGPSGAGKSTLIRCINRLIEPTSGSITLESIELTHLSSSRLREQRRRIGMIFQEYALVERLSVMENVLSGTLGYVPFWRSFFRKFPQEKIKKAFGYLGRVGLMDHVNKRADELSGGQKQRVGIARALAQEPSLLLIDEPTASLDPKTSRQIMRLIKEICKEQQLPAIINIHDVLLAQTFVDRIIGINEGKIVFDGNPSELNEAVLTTIYGKEEWQTAPQEKEAPVATLTPESITVKLELAV